MQIVTSASAVRVLCFFITNSSDDAGHHPFSSFGNLIVACKRQTGTGLKNRRFEFLTWQATAPYVEAQFLRKVAVGDQSAGNLHRSKAMLQIHEMTVNPYRSFSHPVLVGFVLSVVANTVVLQMSHQKTLFHWWMQSSEFTVVHPARNSVPSRWPLLEASSSTKKGREFHCGPHVGEGTLRPVRVAGSYPKHLVYVGCAPGSGTRDSCCS